MSTAPPTLIEPQAPVTVQKQHTIIAIKQEYASSAIHQTSSDHPEQQGCAEHPHNRVHTKHEDDDDASLPTITFTDKKQEQQNDSNTTKNATISAIPVHVPTPVGAQPIKAEHFHNHGFPIPFTDTAPLPPRHSSAAGQRLRKRAKLFGDFVDADDAVNNLTDKDKYLYKQQEDGSYTIFNTPKTKRNETTSYDVQKKDHSTSEPSKIDTYLDINDDCATEDDVMKDDIMDQDYIAEKEWRQPLTLKEKKRMVAASRKREKKRKSVANTKRKRALAREDASPEMVATQSGTNTTGTTSKGDDYLYGCDRCSYNPSGCSYCQTRGPLYARSTLFRWSPAQGQPQSSIPFAKTFRPTDEEFIDPVAYITKIMPEAEQYGIAHIVPPLSFQPPFALLKGTDGNSIDSFKFALKKQPTSRLCYRKGTSSFGNGNSAGTRYGGTSTTTNTTIHNNTSTTTHAADFFGFQTTEQQYTLPAFAAYADWAKQLHFSAPAPTNAGTSSAPALRPPSLPRHTEPAVEPSIEDIESEFWRIVHSPGLGFESLYGQDIEGDKHGSGFPLPQWRKRLLESRLSQHKGTAVSLPEHVNGSVEEKYARHPWNVNNMPRGGDSVLRYLLSDTQELITGVMLPWVYVGSCFSAFCWHIEDHGLYSVNYLHMGAPKVWYGVPACAAKAFEEAMKDALPHLFESAPTLMYDLVTLLSPEELKKRGVPVYKIYHEPNSFVITMPNGYHAGFNTGFNCAEAVNFAAPMWLPYGTDMVHQYRNTNKPCTISHDALIVSLTLAALHVADGGWEERVSVKLIMQRNKADLDDNDVVIDSDDDDVRIKLVLSISTRPSTQNISTQNNNNNNNNNNSSSSSSNSTQNNNDEDNNRFKRYESLYGGPIAREGASLQAMRLAAGELALRAHEEIQRWSRCFATLGVNGLPQREVQPGKRAIAVEGDVTSNAAAVVCDMNDDAEKPAMNMAHTSVTNTPLNNKDPFSAHDPGTTRCDGPMTDGAALVAPDPPTVTKIECATMSHNPTVPLGDTNTTNNNNNTAYRETAVHDTSDLDCHECKADLWLTAVTTAPSPPHNTICMCMEHAPLLVTKYNYPVNSLSLLVRYSPDDMMHMVQMAVERVSGVEDAVKEAKVRRDKVEETRVKMKPVGPLYNVNDVIFMDDGFEEEGYEEEGVDLDGCCGNGDTHHGNGDTNHGNGDTYHAMMHNKTSNSNAKFKRDGSMALVAGGGGKRKADPEEAMDVDEGEWVPECLKKKGKPGRKYKMRKKMPLTLQGVKRKRKAQSVVAHDRSASKISISPSPPLAATAGANTSAIAAFPKLATGESAFEGIRGLVSDGASDEALPDSFPHKLEGLKEAINAASTRVSVQCQKIPSVEIRDDDCVLGSSLPKSQGN